MPYSSHDTEDDDLDQGLGNEDQDKSQDDEGDKGPKSVLDAAMAALSEGDQADKASPAGEDEGGKDADTDDSDKDGADSSGDGERTDENEADEDAKLPFHKHPRFKRLIDERNGLRDQVKQAEEGYGQKAKAWDDMQTFVQQSGLSVEEIDQGFELMRLLKEDPAKAHEMLQPMVSKTGAYTGTALPADLQGKVDAGTVDAETAAELAKERAKSAHLAERRTADADAYKANEASATQDQMVRAVNTMKTAVSKWEDAWKGSDPDFETKHPMVRDKVIALVNTEGMPMTAEAALTLTQRARDEVERQLSSIIPKRKAKRTVTGGASGGTAKPRPKSALEAARVALGE